MLLCVCVCFRCAALKLVERCKKIESRPGTLDEVLVKHTQEHYDLLKSTSHCNDEEHLEDLSSKFDAVYLHPVHTKRKSTIMFDPLVLIICS